MIEDFPDLNCDVEHCVLTKREQHDIHTVINQLNSEERMIIYGIFFENKTQTQMAEIMGISRPVSYTHLSSFFSLLSSSILASLQPDNISRLLFQKF